MYIRNLRIKDWKNEISMTKVYYFYIILIHK